MKKPVTIYILGFLLLFLCINGLTGGLLLMLKPDGSLLAMQSDWLSNSPFRTFTFPGLLLLFFNGVLPGITFLGMVTRKAFPFMQKTNIYKDKFWAWSWSLYCGVITISWIIIQQLLTNYFILQPIVASLGLLIVILTLIPSVQKYYQVRTSD